MKERIKTSEFTFTARKLKSGSKIEFEGELVQFKIFATSRLTGWNELDKQHGNTHLIYWI